MDAAVRSYLTTFLLRISGDREVRAIAERLLRYIRAGTRYETIDELVRSRDTLLVALACADVQADRLRQ